MTWMALTLTVIYGGNHSRLVREGRGDGNYDWFIALFVHDPFTKMARLWI